MQSLVAALRYLTFWGRLAPKPQGATRAPPALYFPFMGLLLGLLLALSNYALSLYLDSGLLSILLIGLLVLATGASHFDGAKNTFDGLFLSARAQVNSETRTLGSLLLILMILLKIRAVEVIDEKIALSLLLAPAFARWTLVVFIFGCREWCEETSRWVADNLRLWHLLLTTVAILGLAYYFLARKGLLIGLCLSVFALITRSILHRRYSVIRGDNFGAVTECSETLSLILLASL